MFVALTFLEEDLIIVQTRMEAEGAKGCLTCEVHPGESVFGLSFEDLRVLGPGGHELEPVKTKPAESAAR